MKFTIEFDEESSGITPDSIKLEVADYLANKLFGSINTKALKEVAQKEFEKKKGDAIKEMKLTLQSWDKFEITAEIGRLFGEGWKNKVADEVFRKLKNDTEFIGKISTEVLKNFNK